jgi:hypothetical protein
MADLFRIHAICPGSKVTGPQPLERRQKKRFPAKEGCLVTLGSDPIRPWQILDISEEGLAFRYVGGAEEPKETSQLDILTGDTVCCIEKVPFRLISDSRMSDPVLQRYPLNRCSVRFGPLTPEQVGQLQSLIRDYTASAFGPAV